MRIARGLNEQGTSRTAIRIQDVIFLSKGARNDKMAMYSISATITTVFLLLCVNGWIYLTALVEYDRM
jgi:hypothetical protein